jgi:hypothetical protein
MEDQKKHPGGRPVKYESAEQIQILINQYFETREKEKKPCTIQGLAIALDLSRQGLLDYSNKEEFFDVINKARARICNSVEEMLFTGQPAAGPIFWLKNNADYKDKQEVAHTGADGKPLTVIVHRGSDLARIPAGEQEQIPDAEEVPGENE